MDTIPCPGCRTDLEPSATVCPICLRPRGKLEITRAYATMREMEKQRRQRPFILAGRLLAAGAAGLLLFRFRAPIVAAAVWARTSSVRFFDLQLASALPPVPAAVPPPAAAVSAPPPGFSAAPVVSAPLATRAGVPRSAEPVALAAEGSPPKAVQKRGRVEDLPLPAFDSSTQWVLFGRVYDLVTLRPIPDAQLPFAAVSGNSGGAGGGGAYGPRSDAEGRFTAVLQRLPDGSSYEIHASRAGYVSSALYESDIPYAQLPLEERRGIVHNAQDGDMTLPPLNDVAGEGSMRRDVFLAPSR